MTHPTQQPEPQAAAGDGKRWRGHTHKELYQLLHDGPGPAASAEPARRWQEISTSLSEIGQDLHKALTQTGTAWSGKAAGRAYDRLAITATWATETSASAAEMRTAVETQAEHIARARADMPAPEDVPATQPDPAVAPAVQVAQTQADLEAPEAAASSAEERAFEVMAAYEQNTSTNSAAMGSFAPPPELMLRDDIRRGGGIGPVETRPSGLEGWHGSGPHDHHRGHHGGERWQPTQGSSAQWQDRPGRFGPGGGSHGWTGPATPGGFGGAVLNPRRGGDDRDRTNRFSSSGGSAGGPGGGGSGGPGGSSGGPGGGSGSGSGGGGTPGSTVGANPGGAGGPGGGTPPPKTGAAATAGLAADMQQAAAASQAAAAAQHAGAPIAPTAGTPVGGQQERMAMRRFGMDAIGSNQWFGDTEEPVVGQSQRRRRDLRQPEELTESVSILDEEHKLPPTVIGDGQSGR